MARVNRVLTIGVIFFLIMYIYLGKSKPCFNQSTLKPHVNTDTKQPVTPKLSFKTVYFGNTTQFRLNYLMNNPSICSSVENLTFIVVVHTATKNFNRRLGIRQTWANANHYKGFTLRTVFFIGRPTGKQLQPLVEEENRQFGDIVQGDFLDTSRNMTYKGVMVYHWISEYCRQAQLILKVDDTMFVNMFRIVQQHLPMLLKRPRQMTCEMVQHRPIKRTSWEEWSLKSEELPDRKEYPAYCRGYFVLITSDLIVPMLKKVSLNPFLWVDDVYLYGLLPEFLDVAWHNIVPRIPEVFENCFQAYLGNRSRPHLPFYGCRNVLGREKMVDIWKMALKNLSENGFPLLRDHTFLSWVLPPKSNNPG